MTATARLANPHRPLGPRLCAFPCVVAFVLLAVRGCAALPALASDRSLPVVIEAVDEICVIETPEQSFRRVVFVRDGHVLATRGEVCEMHWAAAGDGFQLTWQDYWTAERIVTARRMTWWTCDSDPTEAGQNGPWWCQFRNMRDLRQP